MHKESDKALILPNRMDPKLTLNQGPCKVMNCDEAKETLQMQTKNNIEPTNARNVRPHFWQMT